MFLSYHKSEKCKGLYNRHETEYNRPKRQVFFMNATQKSSRNMLIASMCIFGTIGILRRYIPLSSSLVALVRGVVGAVFLVVVVQLRRQKFDREAIRQNLILLILSGVAIGFNWIFLFEAYNYTSVATATLCYYLAPILVILAAPLVLKEKLTLRKGLCTLVALAGMVLVSGVLETGFTGLAEMKGILFGLGAAVLYASVILMNKKMKTIPAYDKTIFQLVAASLSLLPYVLITENWAHVTVTPLSAVLLLVAGTVHTGFAYWMYFGSMGNLNAHTVALFSYIDPILAIVMSMVVLQEPMGIPAAVGAVMILGAAYISEK